MMSIHSFVKSDLEKRLTSIKGKTLGEVDSANVFARTLTNPKITGIAGDVIEQSVMGYPPDTRQEPDLEVDGIPTELKTTGLRASKKTGELEAKEPMSITAVSLDRIASETFEDSSFWHKLAHMLVVYYLYDSPTTVTAAEYAKFPILGHQFHQFTSEDIETLRNDWLLVRNFVEAAQSPENSVEEREDLYRKLSSALRRDLMMIDTAPKFPNRPRFRLKRSVVTSIAQKAINSDFVYDEQKNSLNSYAELDYHFAEIADKYREKTVKDICQQLNIKVSGKSISEQVIVGMLGSQRKKMRDIELFSKIGLIGKSIVLTKEGRRTEDMKLFTIDFEEFTNEDISFETSSFYEYFSNHQILCLQFEEPNISAPLNENLFKGFTRVDFAEEFIESEVRKVWEQIRYLISEDKLRFVPELNPKTGSPRINKTGEIKGAPNFPKSRDGLVFVRGTSSDSTNKPEIVNGIPMYKQQLWIKGSYIAQRLSELPRL